MICQSHRTALFTIENVICPKAYREYPLSLKYTVIHKQNRTDVHRIFSALLYYIALFTLRSALYLSVFMKVARHTKIHIVTMNDFKKRIFAGESCILFRNMSENSKYIDWHIHICIHFYTFVIHALYISFTSIFYMHIIHTYIQIYTGCS